MHSQYLRIQSVLQRKHNTFSWLRCLLILLEEIIAIYSENHTKHTNTLCGQNAELLIVKAACKYSYHWALKG
jgi:hypothetical protein